MKTKSFCTSIAALTLGGLSTLFTSLATANTAYASTLPTASQWCNFVVDDSVDSTPPKLVAGGTTYIPIWYVNDELSGFGVTGTWDGVHKVWSLKTDSSMTPDLTNLNPGSGPMHITINGKFVQAAPLQVATDPTTKKPTTFVPIWYLQQVLERFNILATWDGIHSNWMWYTTLPKSENQAFLKAYPTSVVGEAKQMNTEAGPVTLYSTEPKTSTDKVTVIAVTPDLKTKAFSTNFLDVLGTSVSEINADGIFVSASGLTDSQGDVGTEILNINNGSVNLANGISGNVVDDVWLQDEVLHAMHSVPNGTWDLTGPNGEKEDSATDTFYKYDTTQHSFLVDKTLKGAVGFYDPSLATDPAYDAVQIFQMLAYMEMNPTDTATLNELTTEVGPAFKTTWNTHQDDLAFLPEAISEGPVNLRTISTDDTNGVYTYTYSVDGFIMKVTLNSPPGMKLQSFTLNSTN